MIYLFESRIPENISVFFALKYVYGINKQTASRICKNLGFLRNFKIKDLSTEQINKLLKITEILDLVISTTLKKELQINNKKLVAIKSYRGLRRIQGLPVRGQRTHTNSKNCRKVYNFIKNA